MAIKTFSGSCHCGAVHFKADIDLATGTTRCNCSIRSKARAWFTIVPSERFRLISGAGAMGDYQGTPPGTPHPFLHFRFCKTCGERAFAQGGEGPKGFYAVAVAALDDAEAGELAASIKYVDGRHDRYGTPPEDTRLM